MSYAAIIAKYRVGADERDLHHRAERGHHVRLRRLPGSPSLPEGIMLSPDMVAVDDESPPVSILRTTLTVQDDFGDILIEQQEPVKHYRTALSAAVRSALESVKGPHDLWFDASGNAFISFADNQDATMFRLAFDGALP